MRSAETIRTFVIDSIIDDLKRTLRQQQSAIVVAPPGSGKTVRIAPSLLDEPWVSGKKIIMLEPRRMAARIAAEFMANTIDEKVGETVGYRIRNESRISNKTRIEIVTEGILTRMLQDDASLPETALVIFDEFHERSLHADLGLAFALDARQHIRPDLKILVMSATINASEISAMLEHAPILSSEGKQYPVETRYLRFTGHKSIEELTVEAIHRIIDVPEGDVLVFLPGQREIQRVGELVQKKELPENIDLHLLFGDALPSQQLAAIRPSPGRKKIILSTNIAETSITIEGVRVVIDSGLTRTQRFDPSRGMSRLITLPVSKASADQRRGRAGRLAPGVCYRLWTEQDHQSLPDFSQPEIIAADLAPFALDLARWGSPHGEHLRFLTPIPSSHLRQSQLLLQRLSALDHNYQLTSHGKELIKFPIHPRLAHMIVVGKKQGFGSTACDVAALLDERDRSIVEKDADIDLAARWHQLSARHNVVVAERVEAQALRFRQLGKIEKMLFDEASAGIVLALAFPDRIAKQKAHRSHKYIMTNGTTGILPAKSRLFTEEFMAIGDVDGSESEVIIRMAAPISKESIVRFFDDQLTFHRRIEWDEQLQAVRSVQTTQLGSCIVEETAITPNEDELADALLTGINSAGLESLPWTRESRALQSRCCWWFLSGHAPPSLPDLSDRQLAATIRIWLRPFLSGMRSLEHIKRLDMLQILKSLLLPEHLRDLQNKIPGRMHLPSGSDIPLRYEPGALPVLSVRLQELFGQTETPRIYDGKVSIVLHILSPARRPLSITQDLRSFWISTYPQLRAQLKARYPKHHWPDNPLSASPTNKTVGRHRGKSHR